MADDRRLEVLRAIVEDFVTTREPVGSKALVERHRLGVSPATIRNDMAVLEEQGYIAQPHTSAGRVPTDKGYRLFVDRLSEVRPMSPPERRAIQVFLEGAVGLDDVVDRTVRLLSQITRQTAVVQYPSVSLATVRHVDLVPLPPDRVLIVLILSSGRVEQRLVDLPPAAGTGAPGEPTGLEELRGRVNAAVVGLRLAAAAVAVRDVPDTLSQAPGAVRDTGRAVAEALAQALVEEREERIVVAGTSHLVRRGTEFPGELSAVLEALEEQVVLLRLLHDMAEEQADVAVRIGRETAHESLAQTAVVSSGYGSGAVVARLGVLGPTRMDYPTTIAAVRAVARYASRALDQ
ncbi:heat-inducible transcriptional repressor HrcA [Aquipuribacter nitratireducens]|uniref:Heat-inducible transcription repressor HrcA n=1 Tax=Aquipuribacter nitratireducens TaxID=650104 RepID=A0ABW0GK18_9MICO